MAFDNPLAGEIWSSKHRFSPMGGGGDDTVEATWDRVATPLAATEAPELQAAMRLRFLEACATTASCRPGAFWPARERRGT